MSMTMQDLEDAMNGLATFTRGKDGPVIPLRLNKKEKLLFKQFIEQGFAIRETTSNTFAAYSHWCSINKKPQIYIRNKAKYSYIELDMILTDHRLSEQSVQQIRQVLEKYAVLTKPHNSSLNIQAGGTVSYCNRIPKEKAVQTASELADIANNQANWEKEASL
jgi:hypothetical protein